RRDHAGFSIVYEYRVVVAGDAFIGHFETDELARQSFFFLLKEAITPYEIAFVQFANPAQVRFKHGCRAVNVVAIERHLGFEPESVARRQAAGQNAVWLARFENLVPDAIRFIRIEIDLKAVFASVAGSRDDRRDAVNVAALEPVIFDRGERDAGQRLK